MAALTVKPPRYEVRVWDVLRVRGLRQDWFAQQLGISDSLLSHIKAGRRNIDRAFMEGCARVLGVPEDLLFLPIVVHDSTTMGLIRTTEGDPV